MTRYFVKSARCIDCGSPCTPETKQCRPCWVEARRVVHTYKARVDQSGGPDACWPWTGAKDSYGYGRARRGKEGIKIHRLVLVEKLGRPIAADKETCHTCANRACCNPAHLYEGTHAQNMADIVWARGEKSHSAKLSDDQAAEIRALRGLVPQKVLAARYGVGSAYISSLQTGARRRVA